MFRHIQLISALCLGAAAGAAGQLSVASCPSNQLIGDLGIDGLECQGCEIHGRPRRNESWILFHGEPRIRSLRASGPAYGRLEAGDVVVSIDTLAITTQAGSDRYARLEPGQVVHLEVRRADRIMEVEIVAAPLCGAPPSSRGTRRYIRVSGSGSMFGIGPDSTERSGDRDHGKLLHQHHGENGGH